MADGLHRSLPSMPSTSLNDDDFRFFAGTKVLVTGATGLIGTHLCETLSSIGAEVHGVSRSSRSAAEGAHATRMWSADLRDADAVRRVSREVGPRIIFHLAGKVTARQELALITDTLGCNLLSTVNMLAAFTGSDVEKFVLAGSSEESGDTGVPSSPYAASKMASAIYAEMFHRLYNVPVIQTRLFVTYGPRQETSKVIPHMISSFLANRSPHLSCPARACDFIFVDDVVRGLLMAARSAAPGGASIEFGTGHAIALSDVATELATLTHRTLEPVFGAIETRRFERVAVADVDTTYKLIGWRPIWTMQEGLAKTIEWFEANQARNL